MVKLKFYMNEEYITHIAFSDESNWNKGRFRSICVLSLPIIELDGFEKIIDNVLDEFHIIEFKWNHFDNSKYRKCATNIIDHVIEYAITGKLRVDTLIWDIYDSRHSVQGRDDEKNLQIMYYHLLDNIIKKRWPQNAIWYLCPDEHDNISWDSIYDALIRTSISIGILDPSIELGNPIDFSKISIINTIFKIIKIEPCKSHEKAIIQVTDLFAGMACYSKISFKTYETWNKITSSQNTLFPEERTITLTGSQKERFPVIKYLREKCRIHKLYVSLDHSGALKTFDPKYPINFWWYEPQHELDKAPLKGHS